MYLVNMRVYVLNFEPTTSHFLFDKVKNVTTYKENVSLVLKALWGVEPQSKKDFA